MSTHPNIRADGPTRTLANRGLRIIHETKTIHSARHVKDHFIHTFILTVGHVISVPTEQLLDKHVNCNSSIKIATATLLAVSLTGQKFAIVLREFIETKVRT